MRTITLRLTDTEYDELMNALANMTNGNAYDSEEMRKCGVEHPTALVNAEQKIRYAWNKTAS